ncbi:MAG TPA: OB-fold domain-containing protein [Streptosporangiaceae bacterium]|nr:OB-fold domain-containing protein [Streptosporangiaceae bacterium]
MVKQVPFVDYLVLGDDPHLVSRECASCGALYFDRRNACARCGSREFGTRGLSNNGVVRAFTIVHRATPDVRVPYVSAVVDLAGGGMAKANLVDVEPSPSQVRLGMSVTLATFPIGTDSQGTQAVCFGYRPA